MSFFGGQETVLARSCTLQTSLLLCHVSRSDFLSNLKPYKASVRHGSALMLTDVDVNFSEYPHQLRGAPLAQRCGIRPQRRSIFRLRHSRGSECQPLPNMCRHFQILNTSRDEPCNLFPPGRKRTVRGAAREWCTFEATAEISWGGEKQPKITPTWARTNGSMRVF